MGQRRTLNKENWPAGRQHCVLRTYIEPSFLPCKTLCHLILQPLKISPCTYVLRILQQLSFLVVDCSFLFHIPQTLPLTNEREEEATSYFYWQQDFFKISSVWVSVYYNTTTTTSRDSHDTCGKHCTFSFLFFCFQRFLLLIVARKRDLLCLLCNNTTVGNYDSSSFHMWVVSAQRESSKL